jgi:undecaprenyl phosphate N,N'-diacetylbacillosamine 1-phosphate transferase
MHQLLRWVPSIGISVLASVEPLIESPWYGPCRRGLEFAVAVLGLIALSPLIAASALLIWLEDRGSSPFLKQMRLGRGEEPFGLTKLRTMRERRYRDGRKLTDAERMLRSGRIFRKLSIDELPQLVNVLLGDMSLIGPRPMPVAYQPFFTDEERVRHSVRPGMSGLAQVQGRNFLSWDEKFALDVQYVQNFGPRQDLRIFFLTLWKLIRPQDVGTRGKDMPVESLHEIRAHMLDQKDRGTPANG